MSEPESRTTTGAKGGNVTAARGLSRRAALVASMALAPAAAAAAPVARPDAALMDLAQRWRAAWPDVERIGDALEAAERNGDGAGQDACHRSLHVVFDALADIEDAIATTPAEGVQGLAVKAALLARVFLGPHEPDGGDMRLARSLSADALRIAPYAAALEASPATPVASGNVCQMAAPSNPDAELIAACAGHLAARNAVNAGMNLPDDAPEVLRYSAAFAAVDNAPAATTMAGILALARSAEAESCNSMDGARSWDDPAGAWAGDAVLSLLRLHGETVA